MNKKLKITGFIIVILLIVAAIFLYPLRYKGDDGIIIINNKDYSSLKDILELDYFKNKVVLVDMWGTTCKPCIMEFEHAKDLKKRFNNKPVEFLYLCNVDMIIQETQWKKIIKSKNLKGYHIPIDTDLYMSIWNNDLGENVKNKYWIPHYFIVKDEKIIVYKAAHPSSKEKLYNQIDSVLNLK